MGYKNEQFFNNGQGEVANRVNIPAKNRPFGQGVVSTYPDNTLRFSNFLEGSNDWAAREYKLARGYIRTLTDFGLTSETSGTDIDIIKCNFQFNPSTIVHSVPMRTTLTNMALQSPAQMSQPVGGEVSFAFDLLFDRSYTLNNQADTDVVNSEVLGTPAEANIGVLEDLRALYSVIGQGLSKEQIDFQKRMIIQQAEAQVAVGLDSLDENDKRTPDWDKFFNNNVNFGNSAFLIPMPVRIVFSSLFMVDGYVTQSEVVYTKFSRTMVPMQCSVNLQVNAMYVGFARQKTFLTVNLDEAEQQAKRDIAQNKENAIASLKVIERILKKIKVKVLTEAQYDYTTTDTSLGGTPMDVRDFKNVKAIDCLIVPNSLITTELINRVVSDAPVDANPNKVWQVFEIDIQEGPLYDYRGVDKVSEEDKIKNIFETQSVSIKMDIVCNVYGPFTQAEANNLVSWEKTLAKGGTISSANQATRNSYIGNKLISTLRLYQPNITTLEDWEAFRKGDKRRATKNMTNNTYSNSSLRALASTSTKYFVTVISGTVHPSVASYQSGVMLYYTNAESHAVQTSGNDGDVHLALEFKKKATE